MAFHKQISAPEHKLIYYKVIYYVKGKDFAHCQNLFIYLYLFLHYWGLNSEPTPSPTLFCDGFF
jgi:hypothetical protein